MDQLEQNPLGPEQVGLALTYIELTHNQITEYAENAGQDVKSIEHEEIQKCISINNSIILILRAVYQSIYENLHAVPFVDIAFALNYSQQWVYDNTELEEVQTPELL